MKLRHALVLLVALLAGGAFADEPFRAAPDTLFQIEHIALDLDVDLAGKTASGTAVLDVKAVRHVDDVRLDAVDLQVSSVKVVKGNENKAASFTNDGETLSVRAPLERGEKERLEIAYAVKDPRAGLHFYGPSAKEPDVPLQVWSQGEAQTNRYWIPCIDSPCVRQTTEITAHVPAGFQALSNGRLAEKAEEGKKTRFHWVQDKNHVAYLISLIVGKFHVAKEEWRGKPLLYYVPEKNKDDVERVFGHTKAMLDFFSDKIGVEYAWDKYSQCTVEQFGWGGMENVSATTLNERTLHDARAHLDYDSDGLISHELAHQWWGDLLTCHDWAHIWLNEGFASYFEALWDEKQNGADEFEWNMFEKLHGATDQRCKERPVVDHRYGDPETVFDSRAYPKGAWVLHGLRRRLGDDAFWRAIHRYCAEHQLQTVETSDLRRAFEAETGESLERYFHEATERPGHPVLEVSFSWRDGFLEAVVKQTQKEDPFAVKTQIQVGDKLVPFSMTDEREKRMVLAAAESPKIVRFDPREAIVKELAEHKGEDQWLEQARSDKHPIGRVRAILALAEQRTPGATAAIADRLKDEQWFVASEAAKALGKIGGDAARDALASAVGHANPRVRRAAVEALGAFRKDEKAASAVRTRLEDESYYVEAAAVGALARIDSEDARAVCEKALAKSSHNDVIREAGIDGLAGLEDPSVLPILEKATSSGEYGTRGRALRAWARVAALPTVSDDERRRIVARLVKVVEEEGLRTRWAAIDALSSLGKEAVVALPALDAVAQHDGEGRVRETAKHAAERIRAGTPPSVEIAHLREELQRLKDSEDKLMKRLERVEAKGSRKPTSGFQSSAPEPD